MKSLFHHIKNLFIGLCTVTMLAIPSIAKASDTNQSKEQAMEEKIETQDQRIRELEKRILDMESAIMSGNPRKETAAAPTETGRSVPENKEKSVVAVDESQNKKSGPERIDLSGGEFRETLHVVTGADLYAEDFPGSWPMFGTDFRMKFGGYFKLDALYDFDGAGDNKQFLFSQIPIDGTPEANRKGYFNMLVNEVRFNFDVRKKTNGEPVQRFVLEMDFFDERNNAPRMRHAYVQYGNLIVGQTWSTTTELRAINYMIEWAYGDAIYGTRSKQIRWQQQIDKNWSWAVALENLDFPGIDSRGLPGSAKSRLPLLAARATFENSGSIIMLGGSVNELRWDGQGEGPDATATAWNLILAGRKNIGTRDYVTYAFAFGDGAAEGMGAFAGQNYNATLFPDGSLELNSYWDLSLGYTHKWNDVLSTNLNFVQFNLDSDYARQPDTMDNGSMVHANLIWKLRPYMLTGIEYIWGGVENVNGDNGSAGRIQTTLRYDF